MAGNHTLLFQSIEKLTGVFLEESKLYLLDARLAEIMTDYSLKTYDEVALKIQAGSDSGFLEKVIDNITTHETRFFRDESMYDALVMQIIPEWFEKIGATPANLKGNRLNIWSGACSTGQEPYSISMIIHEKFPALVGNFSIIATDISKITLDKASQGIYSKFEVDRGLNPFFLEKYFEKDGEKFKIKNKIKAPIQFKPHNLITESAPGNYHIVLCRNVVIYFTEPERKKVYEKLKNSVATDGVLIIGSSESLIGYLSNYVLREFGLSRYYEFASKVTFF